MKPLRVATYNIHKGVQGMGPLRRLEIHNLANAIAHMDADIVCLQEVRSHNRKEQRYFEHWPKDHQAEFLKPQGYDWAYRTNAITQHGEHGNALLTRGKLLSHQHEDMSDHRFEQRGLLHCEVQLHGVLVHVLVIHLGLIRASRLRQISQLGEFIAREIPNEAPLLVAGDFNEWSDILIAEMHELGLESASRKKIPTFPSRMPFLQLDHVFVRGLKPVNIHVPRGAHWPSMSDHLPLIAEFEFSGAVPK